MFAGLSVRLQILFFDMSNGIKDTFFFLKDLLYNDSIRLKSDLIIWCYWKLLYH